MSSDNTSTQIPDVTNRQPLRCQQHHVEPAVFRVVFLDFCIALYFGYAAAAAAADSHDRIEKEEVCGLLHHARG